MSDLDQVKTFLFMAGKDHRALLAMQDPLLVDVEIYGFHVQQAVEKGLKAWLCLLEAPFPKMHDLRELASLLRKVGGIFPDEFIPLLGFTDFATTFRYDAYPNFDADIDREATATLVQRFLRHVDHLLLGHEP